MADESTSGLSMMKPRAAKEAPEESEGNQGKYPEVTPPAGYTPPDDAAEGDTFDATVKCRVKGDKICLLTLDGVPWDEEAEEEDEGDPVAPPSMAEAAAAQRTQPGYASI